MKKILIKNIVSKRFDEGKISKFERLKHINFPIERNKKTKNEESKKN